MPGDRFNFPDPADCTQYLSCQDSGQPQNMTCAGGGVDDLVFNPNADECQKISEDTICYRPDDK